MLYSELNTKSSHIAKFIASASAMNKFGIDEIIRSEHSEEYEVLPNSY